ncbi:hypothetical protein J2R96_005714 [Bradyrhizobium elkanii]|nr:hypothetical protein [Bradyrhizobium elkanii]
MSFLSLVLDGGRRTLRQIALVCKALCRNRLAGAWRTRMDRDRSSVRSGTLPLDAASTKEEILSQSRNAILFAAGLM